jgi:hypothetical protein
LRKNREGNLIIILELEKILFKEKSGGEKRGGN